MPDGAYDIGRAIGLPKAVVFERNVQRLGMLPADLARILVEFYGIRSAAEGMLDVADERHRPVLLNWLLQVANTAPQSLMALDAYLGRPQQEYPAAAFEQAVGPAGEKHPAATSSGRRAMIPDIDIHRCALADDPPLPRDRTAANEGSGRGRGAALIPDIDIWRAAALMTMRGRTCRVNHNF